MSKSKTIAYFGVLSGLMFIMLALETLVFKLFLPITPAFFSIPLAISLSLKGKKSDMFIGGTIFGVCSFCLAVLIGYAEFFNPLISIMPRIFIGIVAYYVYFLFSKILASSKNKFIREILPLSISGVFGVITNTVLTVFMLWVFNFTGTANVFTMILTFNFLFELISAIVLVPIIVITIRKVVR